MAMPPITPAQGVQIFQAVRQALQSVGVNFQKASNIGLDVSEKLQGLESVTPESIKTVIGEVVADAKANGPLFNTPGNAAAGDAALTNAPAAGSSGEGVAAGAADAEAAAADAAAADSGAALSDVALVDIAAEATAAAIVL